MRAEFFTTTQPVPKSLLTFLLQDSECVFVNGPPKLILFMNSRSTHPPHLLASVRRHNASTMVARGCTTFVFRAISLKRHELNTSHQHTGTFMAK